MLHVKSHFVKSHDVSFFSAGWAVQTRKMYETLSSMKHVNEGFTLAFYYTTKTEALGVPNPLPITLL